jgi:excisionase family DNA binding protein
MRVTNEIGTARIVEAPSTVVASPLLTVAEVAEMLRVPISWVYERTRSRAADRIPGFRLGKYWRFRRADVLAWLEGRSKGVLWNA